MADNYQEDASQIELIISDQLERDLETRLIGHEEIRQVIAFGERTKLKFIDEQGISLAHLTIGIPTIWVEYQCEGGNSYRVFEAYSHRMHIEEPGR